MRPGSPVSDLVTAIERLDARSSGPLLVALDGRSGSGKSTLAAAVATRTGALVIDGDDFYRGAEGASWDAIGPAEKVDLVIDRRRQRALLERLRDGEQATWQPYDWEADE